MAAVATTWVVASSLDDHERADHDALADEGDAIDELQYRAQDGRHHRGALHLVRVRVGLGVKEP